MLTSSKTLNQGREWVAALKKWTWVQLSILSQKKGKTLLLQKANRFLSQWNSRFVAIVKNKNLTERSNKSFKRVIFLICNRTRKKTAGRVCLKTNKSWSDRKELGHKNHWPTQKRSSLERVLKILRKWWRKKSESDISKATRLNRMLK
jgi:hypothetical protein